MDENTNTQAPVAAAPAPVVAPQPEPLKLVQGVSLQPSTVVHHSTLFGVSIRGWVALLLILTVCIMGFMKIEVKEPLYSLVLTVSSFYFGHQIASASNKKT